MLNSTHVSTTYANGTIISMDAVSMKHFLEDVSITVISQCREMKIKENKNLGTIENTTNLAYYDELVAEYCDGVHGAVLSNMLCQMVQILYRFVEDIVLNQSTAGLYLLREKPKNGKPVWQLILLALDEYMFLVHQEHQLLGHKIPSEFPNYTKYNKEFTKLMES